MEDLFSGFEGAGMMRDCLLLGTVMEIMDSAFKVGVRSSSGIISTIFRPYTEKNIDPYPSFIMGAGILNSSLTWVTFLRDAVLAFGVYLTCIYDHEVQAIGGTWQIVGWATVFCGVLNTVMEFLKVINFGFFDDKSNFTYYVFQLVFTVWLFIFGMHCKSLVSGEEKGMLDGDASSGSDVSDGEAPIASAPKEESSEEEAPKKHRRHRKTKEVSSDDDV